MTDISTQQLDCGGHPIHTLQAGPAAGPLVLLLHGKMFKAATWQETGTLAILAKAGYRALALDMPGFGNTPAADIKPAEILKKAISQATPSGAILLGPSMGGRTALEFTLDNPDLVKGLVLVGAVGVQENRERLKEIALPRLAVWGGEDTISPLANGHLLEQEIRDAELAVIPGAPHPCYLDQTDEWHRILLGFLTDKLPAQAV
jgi:abhydrolase domain-containing protein 14